MQLFLNSHEVIKALFWINIVYHLLHSQTTVVHKSHKRNTFHKMKFIDCFEHCIYFCIRYGSLGICLGRLYYKHESMLHFIIGYKYGCTLLHLWIGWSWTDDILWMCDVVYRLVRGEHGEWGIIRNAFSNIHRGGSRITGTGGATSEIGYTRRERSPGSERRTERGGGSGGDRKIWKFKC
jgi:hypothetical protein